MRVPCGSQVLPQVLSLIADAAPGSTLRLVCGFFEPKAQIIPALKKALDRGVKVTLITRGGRSLKRHRQAAAEFEECGMTVHYVPWLHAKLYASEREAIATSMNLTENESDNAGDMAVCVYKNEDPPAYKQLCAVFDHFLGQSKLATLDQAQPTGESGTSSPKVATEPQKSTTTTGHCIRCGGPAERNPDKPLCRICYEAWAQYKKPTYKEKFCHECGEPSRTSKKKPSCGECFASSGHEWRVKVDEHRRTAVPLEGLRH
jgi:PLD-like domain